MKIYSVLKLVSTDLDDTIKHYQSDNFQLSTFNFQPYPLSFLEANSQLSTLNSQLKSEHRKREWLAVRVLLYKMTGEIKEISYLESGRPYLIDNSYQISISHTRGYVAVILSKTHRVGIDIEVLGDKAMKVAHKFVDEKELIYPETDKITKAEMLTMIWSAKETMYKCMDSREILFREELHMDVNIPLFEQSYFPAHETHTPNRQNFEVYYMLQADEFVMTYAMV
ncbi:4'-phosphopantetheinyl transferase superfamily protein [Bacteroides sp. 519]|uniref:4'-phosphopantetheinyl transferase family protein n=1 Tax=Bacteroides sp. 519 TaxID=2302937 RepID=UPI0013D44AB9|nr:4'-phosphopantetheinyl transferase superfamily protein [Bacteroides sp. 519]NDV60285.1 siderophore biosynthesis protein [Bacteroides sp. 519]